MSDWKFDRDQIQAFRFVRCDLDPGTGQVELAYAFDDGPELVERIGIPGAPFTLDAAREAAVAQALRLLHLIAGVSYYKAAVPATIHIEGEPIDAATAALLVSVYENGLGEFAYRNGLSLRGKIRFPHVAGHGDALLPPLQGEGRGGDGVGQVSPERQHHPHPTSPALGHSPRALLDARTSGPQARLVAPLKGRDQEPGAVTDLHALVAIGGGKDSLVSIEALRAAGVAQTVAWIGGSQLIRACAERTGLPTLAISRQLAPALFEYNRLGAWNGHIPVTAVNSAILVLAALLRGDSDVVFSNERSASYGSTIPGTGEVNHQWSKGWDFERSFGEHVEGFAPVRYWSLLRPLSELAVARQFARTDRYDAHFSSCNRNFHILGERPASRWCGQCPKCHFVFLALAPFMPKPRLTAIFGRNLLDEPAQQAGFDALIEYRDHKPFECVGEARESRAAFAALAALPAWREDALVARFAREIQPQLRGGEGDDLASLLAASDTHRIPAGVWGVVRGYFGA